MATVWIPAPLQDLTGGNGQVQGAGGTVREVVEDLERQFPGIRARLCDGDALRTGMAVSIDGEVSIGGMRAAISEESEIHFVPAIGGGRE